MFYVLEHSITKYNDADNTIVSHTSDEEEYLIAHLESDISNLMSFHMI